MKRIILQVPRLQFLSTHALLSLLLWACSGMISSPGANAYTHAIVLEEPFLEGTNGMLRPMGSSSRTNDAHRQAPSAYTHAGKEKGSRVLLFSSSWA